jgi:hypothetical protein
VKDSTGATASASLTLTVTAAVTITTTQLPSAAAETSWPSAPFSGGFWAPVVRHGRRWFDIERNRRALRNSRAGRDISAKCHSERLRWRNGQRLAHPDRDCGPDHLHHAAACGNCGNQLQHNAHRHGRYCALHLVRHGRRWFDI